MAEEQKKKNWVRIVTWSVATFIVLVVIFEVFLT